MTLRRALCTLQTVSPSSTYSDQDGASSIIFYKSVALTLAVTLVMVLLICQHAVIQSYGVTTVLAVSAVSVVLVLRHSQCVLWGEVSLTEEPPPPPSLSRPPPASLQSQSLHWLQGPGTTIKLGIGTIHHGISLASNTFSLQDQ